MLLFGAEKVRLTYFMEIAIVIVLFAVLAYWFYRSKKESIEVTPDLIDIVQRNVPFIHALDEDGEQRFYKEVVKFVNEHDFEGLQTEISLEDEVLVASCAVMLFLHVGTDYLKSLNKMYVSETAINYESLPKKAAGFLKQKRSGFDLYISRKSLIYGFRNVKDNKNVGVHELAHLLDGLDGNVDGLPQLFLKETKLEDWKNLVIRYKEVIKSGEIDDYALTNKAEFFAVLTEYFFENPFAMQQKHLDLYRFFVSIYKVDLVKGYKDNYSKRA